MPEYEFQRNDGSRVALFFETGKAPLIGTSIRRRGERLTRLPPNVRVIDHTVNFVSHSQPRYIPGKSKFKPTVLAKEYTKDGKPVFKSKNEVREYVANVNGTSPISTIDYD